MVWSNFSLALWWWLHKRLSKMPRYYHLLIILLLIPLLSYADQPSIVPLGATSGNLVNPSFEFGGAGWSLSNPGILHTAVPSDPFYPAPDGSTVLLSDSGDCTSQFAFSAVQIVDQLEPFTLYELTVDVFPLAGEDHRLWFRMMDAETDFEAFDEDLYRPSFNNDQETIDLIPGQWQTIRLNFSSSDVPAYIDDFFQIQLQGCQMAVDNFQLYELPLIQSPGNITYYISESGGDDSNDGLSELTPWKSFQAIRKMYFNAGDQVLLKRGDLWNEEMMIRGMGTSGNPVTLGSYGTGDLPHIDTNNLESGRAITVQNPSFWTIRDMSASDSKLGLYLRYYLSYGNQDVLVENCQFQDMDSWTVDTPGTNYEVSFNTAVFVGGRVAGNQQFNTVLDGLTVRNCGFENCTAGFLAGWYFPELIYNRITNLLVEDSYATKVSAGGVMVNSVEDGIIRRFRTYEPLGRDDNFIWGSTGGIVSSSRNILFEDCEFSETDRMWFNDQAGDGCGLDIDGRNINVTVRDTIFHGNDAPGLLFLSTYAVINSQVTIEDSVMFNNGLDGAVTFGGNAWEIKATDGAVSGQFENLGLYPPNTSLGHIYNPNPAQVSLSNIRYLDYENDVLSRSDPSWNFNTNGDFEGWTGFNDWDSASVINGVLEGRSSGNDAYVYSPPVWINTHRQRAITIEMSVDQGNLAQLFFNRETDPLFDGEKTVPFEVIPDGDLHEYELHLRGTDAYRGIVTQLRIDPTMIEGATFRVSEVQILDDVTETLPWSPESLRALRVNGGDIALSWKDVADNEEHFVLERAFFDADFQWVATLPAGSESFLDSEAPEDGEVRYRLRAFNKAGFSAPREVLTTEFSDQFLIY